MLTIVSHNAFWFQGAPFGPVDPPAPDAEVLDRLCEIYVSHDPDVICVQEVQSESAFEAVAERLGMPGFYCPGNELAQYGGAVFGAAPAAHLAADSRRPAARAHRMWQRVELAHGEGRLRVCHVHLPSNRQLGPERSGARRLEDLTEALQAGNGAPDVVLGDFNERPGGPVGHFMRERGYEDACVLTGQPDAATSIGGHRGDYIWLGRTVAARLVACSVMDRDDLTCGLPGKETLSDHLPLRIVLDAAR